MSIYLLGLFDHKHTEQHHLLHAEEGDGREVMGSSCRQGLKPKIQITNCSALREAGVTGARDSARPSAVAADTAPFKLVLQLFG
jgi:hypothetical protein